MEESKVVTVKEQRAHVRKIKKLVTKLIDTKKNNVPIDKHYLFAFTEDEVATLESALACHWCAITIDMKSRKEREREALNEIMQEGSRSQGENHPGEPSGQEETDTAR